MPDVLIETPNSRAAILKILKTAPLTSSELRTRLFSYSIRIAEYEVLKDLRELQKDGLIDFDLGRWCIRKNIKISSTLPEPAISSRTVPQTLMRSTPSNLPPWSPSQSSLVMGAISSNAEETVLKQNVRQPNFSGPWGTCRKLLGYYSDCVRNDEGCEASGYLQDQGKRFIYLRQFGSWYPKAGKP